MGPSDPLWRGLCLRRDERKEAISFVRLRSALSRRDLHPRSMGRVACIKVVQHRHLSEAGGDEQTGSLQQQAVGKKCRKSSNSLPSRPACCLFYSKAAGKGITHNASASS